jgi:hypothetical protein
MNKEIQLDPQLCQSISDYVNQLKQFSSETSKMSAGKYSLFTGGPGSIDNTWTTLPLVQLQSNDNRLKDTSYPNGSGDYQEYFNYEAGFVGNQLVSAKQSQIPGR